MVTSTIAPDFFPPSSGARAAPAASQLTRLALTPRDARVFRDLYRHRILPAAWLAREHFGASLPAAWERLRKLGHAGYVEAVSTTHGGARGYRLTARGRRHVGVATRPRRRDAGTDAGPVLHTMTVAEVAAWVARKGAPAGWRLAWVTEQEMLDGEAADWLPAGHLPDGVIELRHHDAGEILRVAVEVELHEKTPGRYPEILAWYRRLLERGAVQRVRWYCPDEAVAAAVRRALPRTGFGEDGANTPSAEVRLLDPAVPVYGRPERTRPAGVVGVAGAGGSGTAA